MNKQSFKTLLLLLATSSILSAYSLRLVSAGATFSQPGYGPEKTIDGEIETFNGWAVASQTSTTQKIWWQLDMPHGDGYEDLTEFKLSFRGTDNLLSTFMPRQIQLCFTMDAVVDENSQWNVITVDEIISSNSDINFLVNANNQITVANPGSLIRDEDWTIRASIGLGGTTNISSSKITGFAIIASPNGASLGYGPNGNFILTEFQVELPDARRLFFEEGMTSAEARYTIDRFGNADFVSANISATAVTATSGADYMIETNFVSLSSSSPSTSRGINIYDDTVSGEGIEYLGVRINYTGTNTTSGVYPKRYYIYLRDADISSYGDWVLNQPLFGAEAEPDADPNQDGLANLTAYIFGQAGYGPSSFPDGSQPEMKILNLSGVRGALSYIIPVLRNDVRFIIEESEGLGSWTEVARRDGYGIGSQWTGNAASRIQETQLSSGELEVTCGASDTLSNRPKMFMRLRLETISGGNSGSE